VELSDGLLAAGRICELHNEFAGTLVTLVEKLFDVLDAQLFEGEEFTQIIDPGGILAVVDAHEDVFLPRTLDNTPASVIVVEVRSIAIKIAVVIHVEVAVHVKREAAVSVLLVGWHVEGHVATIHKGRHHVGIHVVIDAGTHIHLLLHLKLLLLFLLLLLLIHLASSRIGGEPAGFVIVLLLLLLQLLPPLLILQELLPLIGLLLEQLLICSALLLLGILHLRLTAGPYPQLAESYIVLGGVLQSGLCIGLPGKQDKGHALATIVGTGAQEDVHNGVAGGEHLHDLLLGGELWQILYIEDIGDGYGHGHTSSATFAPLATVVVMTAVSLALLAIGTLLRLLEFFVAHWGYLNQAIPEHSVVPLHRLLSTGHAGELHVGHSGAVAIRHHDLDAIVWNVQPLEVLADIAV